MRPMRVYEEVVDFIAAGPSPGKVVAFRPSEAARRRVADLIRREKAEGLPAEEASELEHYLQLEHLMRLAKARAKQHLPGE
jgi:O-succinylbenzoate synthase